MEDSELETGPGARPPRAPRPGVLRDKIRSISTDTSRVFWTDHALDQMADRAIFDKDVLNVLRNGEIRGAIQPGEEEGEWKAKVVGRVKGSREVGVVTVVCDPKTQLLIVTAEWEDIR